VTPNAIAMPQRNDKNIFMSRRLQLRFIAVDGRPN